MRQDAGRETAGEWSRCQAGVLACTEALPGHFLLSLSAPALAVSARPGQFVHVECSDPGALDPLLRRPFSLYGIDRDGGVLKVLFRVVGKGTAWLARRSPGETVDIMGPLGRGFPPPPPRLLVVGGGIGTAPLVAAALEAAAAGTVVAALVGARTRSLLVGVRDMEESGIPVRVATDDGSLGHEGPVTALLASLLACRQEGATAGDPFSRVACGAGLTVYACGPKAMLREVAGLTAAAGVSCFLSLEARMACGVGACNGCVYPAPAPGGEGTVYRRVCRDGPVVEAGEAILADRGGEAAVSPVDGPAAASAGLPTSAPLPGDAVVRTVRVLEAVCRGTPSTRAVLATGPETSEESVPAAGPATPGKSSPEGGPDLTVRIGSLVLKNPVLVASGTFGFGRDYAPAFDVRDLGGLVVKTVTLAPRIGNSPPRVAETPAGMLNSIGLQNPGVDAFLADELPYLRGLGVPVIVSIGGEKVGEYVRLAEMVEKAGGVEALELNISCPNVPGGGIAFGQDPEVAYRLVRSVRGATSLPMVAKLTSNVTGIAAVAEAVVAGGADAVTVANTLVGMVIDVDNRRPLLGAAFGGLSGPAIRPVAVRMVWEVAGAVGVPVIGSGGIVGYRDALEFIMAGATAVSVGTALFRFPRAPVEVAHGLAGYLRRKGIGSITELVGAARRDGTGELPAMPAGPGGVSR